MAERSRRLHGESGSTAQPRLGMVQRHFTGSAPGPEPRSTASSTSASSSSSGVDVSTGWLSSHQQALHAIDATLGLI